MPARFGLGLLAAAIVAFLAACSDGPTPPRIDPTDRTHEGNILDFNVGLSPCSAPDMRRGRVVAVTERAIVIADTANPIGGFTDEEYRAVGVTFDTLVAPLDEDNFGTPADVDDNGRVLLFFTRAVNALTTRGDDAVVGGFFFARDLFPKLSQNGLDGCSASNEGEMFYLLVPDPQATVSDARSKDYVRAQTIATTAHEYQHLINASRRLYVNTTAQAFEETWLNEGLSHVAEELMFYHATGLQSRQNIDITMLRASAARLAAFNEFQNFNFGRYRTYLEATTDHGPYHEDDNDDLETRGAIWSLLRYLADHSSVPDRDVWRGLVNTPDTGLVNLTNRFGPTVTELIRDWSTSVYTDDLSLEDVTTPTTTSVTLSGGASGSDYTLAVFNGEPRFASAAGVTFTAAGIGAPPVAVNRLPSRLTPAQPSFARLASRQRQATASRFERRLRALEIAELRSRIPAARSWLRTRTVRTLPERGRAARTTPSMAVTAAAVAGAAYQQPSWNFRSIYDAYRDGGGNPIPSPFPVPSTELADGVPSSITLNGGSVGYVRFSVPIGGSANVSWTTTGVPASSVSVRIIKTR